MWSRSKKRQNFLWATVFLIFLKGILGLGCVLALGTSVFAQLSDLRHSRQPLPGISEISQVGILVHMGAAQDLLSPITILETVQPRLEQLGYRVAEPSTHSSGGLWLQIHCQVLREKINAVSSQAGKGAIAEVRVLGPPCELAYSFKQQVVPWKNVDRLIYSESVATMQRISQGARRLNPKECVEQFFHLYDFPVLLAAEWGHINRLLQVLKNPDTDVSRQRLILILLGETQVQKGYPVLVQKLRDPEVAKEAAEALGYFGLQGQKHLLSILQDGSSPSLQVSAAKGLGRIAAATGNSQQTPLFLEMVKDPMVDLRVRTELVWALGKAPDMQAYSTLLGLEREIWNDPSPGTDLQEFREAVDWSIREVKQGGHGDDF